MAFHCFHALCLLLRYLVQANMRNIVGGEFSRAEVGPGVFCDDIWRSKVRIGPASSKFNSYSGRSFIHKTLGAFISRCEVENVQKIYNVDLSHIQILSLVEPDFIHNCIFKTLGVLLSEPACEASLLYGCQNTERMALHLVGSALRRRLYSFLWL